MYNIALFVSGRGSNLKAVFSDISNEDIRVCAVISDKKECGALEFARENGIPVFTVTVSGAPGTLNYNQLIIRLINARVDLLVLAGFLKKLPDELIDEFEGRIINIHPALLPSHGGKGMYGINVHKAVFDSSAKVSGASVHFVDKIYDHGMIIAQQTVDISDAKSPEEIAARVLEIEHQLLPLVVRKFAHNKIIRNNNSITILD
jgi:formyltetrahydrofolate-dependent phosphoribosylglycinamide formyltransferase